MLENKWSTKVVKLDDVILLEENNRVISKQALQGLKASIRRFGLVELLIWNERTKHLVSGHQRFSVLKEAGVKELPMMVVNLSLEDELAAALTMNNSTIEGEFDEPIMKLIGQVEESSPELFSAVNITDLKEKLEKKLANVKIDVEEEPGEEWDTECPCCGNKWKVSSKDITIMGKNK